MTEAAPYLPWQKNLWNRLIHTASSGRLGHALLICGDEGVGKAHFTSALAKFLLCQKPSPQGACNNCSACIQFNAGSHPDFQRLLADSERRDIPIDAVRALTESLTMTSHDGSSKVAIIAPVDLLNASGFNALLKTLEEPSNNSHLMLTSHRPQALPATIRSRCQIFTIAAPDPQESVEWLAQQRPELSTTDLSDALTAAGNAPLKALEEADPEAVAQRAQWRQKLIGLLKKRESCSKAAAAVAPKVDRRLALRYLQWNSRFWHGQTRSALGKDAPKQKLATLLQAADIATEAQRRVEGNASPLLTIEQVLHEQLRLTT